ncbi:bifunctional folylpolyglutamate synthase/dihydrofolate synthase [Defluviitalea phaphyphila]|uniref:bifunctional folylpolyglutamate synthase/dihydrofolate synthase n=1 Tax=Defluviitalea phaphyphila TaxID=1473580 RepID=UPI0007307CFA|nr:folylpolyglutamate synthase/dihydrofolate synthase family protein [Defluviitalea phaphyphila]
MNYSEVINYINKIENFGSKLGLSRIKELLKHLGNPEKNLKVIHVAGTNGKGSVCAMLSYILVNSKYNVGVYTSPHLERYNERIKINNEEISNEDFSKLGEKIIEKAKKCEEHPTVFECLTAMALLYFAEKNVDFVILEVGLGGRYDATNVIDNPLVSVITSISMDHMDVLGDTIEKIAYEKAGIIKKNCSTVLYFPNNKVYNIIKDICKDLDSSFNYVSYMDVKYINQSIKGTTFSIKTDKYVYNNLEISLIGEHQIYNTALVLLVVEVLKEKGIIISEKSIRKGLKECRWPGRMEIISKSPIILLDGAHNKEGIEALVRTFDQYFPNKEINLLIGVLKDKPYELMLDKLLPYVKNIIITEPKSPRKLAVDELEKIVKKYNMSVFKDSDIHKAFNLAYKLTYKDGILCCAGSLYLIGELKNILKERGMLRD